MIKPMLSARAMLLVAMLTGGVGSFVPTSVHAATSNVQQKNVLKGRVIDATGEPAVGAYVIVVGTSTGTTTEVNGSFTLKNVKPGASIKVSLIGYKSQTVKWDGSSELNFTLEEETSNLNEVVVTAMGITRKASSLTYSTQMLRSDELMKVQDPNLVNSIEGKISGVTITPSAGGAGGASKITLRGNKSILGNNAPLIVVDGVPMTNNIRGQISGTGFAAEGRTEGSDPLSMINPDDIESMNILKGANAAALYGSAAANGVVMITTKKGKEGKLDVNFTSNIIFDTPLLTPNIQNVYGGYDGNALNVHSWGNKLNGENSGYTIHVPNGGDIQGNGRDIHLRNAAGDDVRDFFRTGFTANNSASLSGGTEKIRTYFSFANSHSDGMIESNSYNRNTIAFRQNYKFWDRVSIDANANYVQTKTRNRVGGGVAGNPIYDLYTMPRDVDFGYYRNNYVGEGKWLSQRQNYYKLNNGSYTATQGQAELSGPLQNWAFQSPGKNNPYWLLRQNSGINREDRFYGSLQGKVDIYDGLAFQARVSLDQTKYNSESKRHATTWDPASMNAYGRYWLTNSRTSEIYTDYLLSYNKQIQDWSVSTTAGWVGHVIKGETTSTDAPATFDMTRNGILTELPKTINHFEPNAGGPSVTNKSRSSNWDKAALFTTQFGWKERVYFDASYRHDWYRTFRQFSYLGTKDNYGYFGFGANAIISELLHLKDEYIKYRLSYSEVGNSIPNVVMNAVSYDPRTGTYTVGGSNSFDPIPEKTKSFETGLEMQFFNNRLNVDITYYNSAMHNLYLNVRGTNGKAQPVNSGRIRNQGFETTIGYDWQNVLPGLRWKTSMNFSYNFNKIERTYRDSNGFSQDLPLDIANGLQLKYVEGQKYGNVYASDYTRWATDVYQTDAEKASNVYNTAGNGKLIHKAGDIYVNSNGTPSFDGNSKTISSSGRVLTQPGRKYGRFLGNMNSDVQLSWSNTFYYKNFSLYLLINGRIGGKVISLTESYLDRLGLSERTAQARLKAEKEGIKTASGAPGMYINEGRDIVPIKEYYEAIGTNDASSYVYNATNFRVRELSLGYTWRNLFGENKNLSVSAVARNLFFIYRDAPVDPDISLSTGNGLNGFEMFNMPSARSFGFNVKLNF